MKFVHILKHGVTFCRLQGSNLPSGDEWVSFQDVDSAQTKDQLVSKGAELCHVCVTARACIEQEEVETMKIKFGEGKTEYGPGVAIQISGDEVACAIDLWLYAQGVVVQGPRTISDEHGLMRNTRVYVDPSGSVIHEGVRFSGRGPG